MEDDHCGLGTDNTVVFSVKPSVSFRPDVIEFLDTSGLQATANDHDVVQLCGLFRNAKFLKQSLQRGVGGMMLEENVIYLVCFHRAINNRKDALIR